MLEYHEHKPSVNLELSRFVGCAQVVTSKFVESSASVIPAASRHFTVSISITHFTLHPADITLLRHTVIVFAVRFYLRIAHYRVSCCSIQQNATLESCMLSCALQMCCIGKTSFPSRLIQFLQISVNMFPDSQR